MLEKGCDPRLPEGTLRKYSIYIYPTASRLKIIPDKVKHHEKQSFNDTLTIQSRSVTRVTNFALHGANAVQVELSGELENKHPTFPVILIRPYRPSYEELFPLRNPTPLTVPPVEQNDHKKIKKNH
ncbi:hypothetical protein O181_054891 [Austropuccinia psidii MF-1]|uniref:Uncharacterized protein n=1 Tax=Austropuccinia psidii MF-1 TaxID=1389203 RepID=A0A9Q3E3C8_9BASI|nr:hypothetical protein [Austropuccinia psidii MF-1]